MMEAKKAADPTTLEYMTERLIAGVDFDIEINIDQ